MNVISPEKFLALLSVQGPVHGSCLPPLTPRTVIEGNVDLRELGKSRPPSVSIPPCRIKGNLKATSCLFLRNLSCTVEGNVDVSGSGLTSLGENFSTAGFFNADACASLVELRGHFSSHVSARRSGLVSVSRSVRIGGSLDIRDCRALLSVDGTVVGNLVATGSSLSRLGQNFRCQGNVNLRGCKSLKEIGFIGRPGQVCLSNSGVQAVFSGFQCEGSLLASNAHHLVSLGENPPPEGSPPSVVSVGLRVGGNVATTSCRSLRSVSLRSVTGSVSLSDCPSLESLTGTIRGDLTLSHCGVLDLGEGLAIGKNLLVEKCSRLRSISSKVGRNLEISEAPSLESMADRFTCARDAVVQDCPSLKKISGVIGGDLLLFGPLSIPCLDRSLRVFGGMRVAGGTELFGASTAPATKAVKIGQIDTSFGGEVILTSALLGRTGSSFSCQSLHISGCPSNFDLSGRVDKSVSIESCPVEMISAAFECGGSMKLEGCLALAKLNCSVEGDLLIFKGSSPALLPAFSCAGQFTLLHCVDDKGRVIQHRASTPPPSTKFKVKSRPPSSLRRNTKSLSRSARVLPTRPRAEKGRV